MKIAQFGSCVKLKATCNCALCISICCCGGAFFDHNKKLSFHHLQLAASKEIHDAWHGNRDARKGTIRLGTLASYAHRTTALALLMMRMPSICCHNTKLCLTDRRHCRLIYLQLMMHAYAFFLVWYIQIMF